jgi:GNAT superfamily N-acetyltransferase
MTDAAACRRLEWDSAFFGVPIARIEVPWLDARAAAAALAWCRAEGIACLYYLCPVDAAAMAVAERHGFRAVDVRMTFERPCVADPPAAAGVSVRPYMTSDREALRAVARGAFLGTRFDADRRFASDRVRDLYDVWLTKSCDGWAETVLVALDGNVPAGFVTCHDDGGGASRIGLIGVADFARGRGNGRALVQAAVACAGGRGARVLTVATQARNIAAQRLYQRAGFLTSSVRVWYHRWFETRSA